MANATQNNRSVFMRLVIDMSAYKLWIILSLLGSLVQVFLTVYLPILIGQAINVTLGQGQVDFDALLEILLKMVLVIIANALIQAVNPILYNKVTYDTSSAIRMRVLERIHSLPLSEIDKRSTGDLVSRITTDTDQLADGLNMVFNQFFVGLLTILITIFTMARLDILMMALVVVLTPLSLFLSRFIAVRSYDLFQKQTESRGRHASFIEESIQLSDLIRLFNAQEDKVDNFDEINQEYSEHSLGAIFYSSTVNPGTRFINAVIYLSVTFLGAIRIMNGGFTVGELATFLNYANQYTKPFNDISSVLTEIQGALACALRLYEIIDLPLEEETGYKDFGESIEGKVNINRGNFSYSKEEDLIEDLTLSVHPGQTVAIVGPTGAGKSTLINLLMRFYELDQGQILIDNQPITDYRRDAVRGQFGMVLQETWLKNASIHDNIAYGHPTASRDQVIEAAKSAHAHRFIELLADGYDTVLTDNASALSTGQQQLLSIARIFVEIPHMLILDEATSSIDTRTEVLIQNAFSELMTERTSFIIAHRLSTIQNADIILVMKDGKIVEQGDHHSLMQGRSLYYSMQTSRTLNQED